METKGPVQIQVLSSLSIASQWARAHHQSVLQHPANQVQVALQMGRFEAYI